MKPNALSVDVFCQRAVIFCACALIYFLPISIALVESFSGAVIFFFIIKKVNQGLAQVRGHEAEKSWINKVMLFWRGFKPQGSILGWILAVNIGFVFTSVIFSHYFMISLFSFVAKYLEGCLLFYALAECFIKSKYLKWFVGIFAVSAVLICLSGINQFINHIDFVRGNPLSEGRVSSSLRHANDFGAFLIIVVTLIFAVFLSLKQLEWPKALKVMLVGVGILAITCLGLTYSRSAWIGIFFAIACVGIINRRYLASGLFITLFIACFLPLMVYFRHVSFISDDVRMDKDLYTQYVSTAKQLNATTNAVVINPDNHSDLVEHFIRFYQHALMRINFVLDHFAGMGRLNFWQDALQLIKNSPVLGMGLNTYTKVSADYHVGSSGYPHNCYLQMAAEIGIIGLLLFFLMIIVLYVSTVKVMGKSKDVFVKAVAIGSLAGLVGFLVQSAFDTTLYSVQLANLMWIIMGIVVACVNITLKESAKLTK